MSTTYADAGVDRDAAAQFKRMIRERVAQFWPDAAAEIGPFAGRRALPTGAEYHTSSMDGVGSKAILQALVGRFTDLGWDAVAMSAVDAYVAGAKPDSVLDAITVGKLDPERHIGVIEGAIRACLQLGCVLLGGETAEVPRLFRHPWMVEVVTTTIGFPDSERPYVPVRAGQLVYGTPSNGLGANGFSLARKVFRLDEKPSRTRQHLNHRYGELDGLPLGAVLLAPTPIWTKELDAQVRRGVCFAGHAHITGGGFIDNIPRILPAHLKIVLDRNAWLRPPIFHLIETLGKIEIAEMDRAFNNGIMVVSLVDPAGPEPIHHGACRIGDVVARQGSEPQVELIGPYRDEQP